MINSFLEFHCDRFQRYGNRIEQAYATEAKKIAAVLANNHNLESLAREVNRILKTLPSPTKYSLVEKPPQFFQLMDELSTDINARKNLKPDELIGKIQTKETSNNTINHLLSFLTETLRHPDFLLHSRTRALTSTLARLDDIIDHLITLEPVERSSTPRPGSFDAEILRSETHGVCIDLIRANSAVFNESNATWSATNDLLQELLIINRELITEPAPKPSRCSLQ